MVYPQTPPDVMTKRLAQILSEAEQTDVGEPEAEPSGTTHADDDGTWLFFVGNVSVVLFHTQDTGR